MNIHDIFPPDEKTKTWAQRKEIGEKHEDAVRDRLNNIGWLALSYGQGMQRVEVRNIMKRYTNKNGSPALLRWLPDIITMRGEKEVFFVDAKGGRGPNYLIEISSFDAHTKLERLGPPIIYVFFDFSVITHEDYERGIQDEAITSHCPTSQWRTAYYRLNKNRNLTVPFDEFFR